MELQKKESYTEPVLVVHELLRDITAQKSGQKYSDCKASDGVGACG
jgi:hypothetical protein